MRFAGQQFIHVPTARFKPGFEVTGGHDGQRGEVGTCETLLYCGESPDPLAQRVRPLPTGRASAGGRRGVPLTLGPLTPSRVGTRRD